MLSSPIALTASVRLITRVSIRAAACGFTTVANFPQVFGSVFTRVNTVVEFRRPVIW